MRSWRWTLAVIGAAVAIVAWALWPSSGAAPRSRAYLPFTACLLTDGRGLTGAAAPVWAGMQDTSAATRAKVQYLPATGAGSADEVRPYLATLVERHCDLVVAVGSGPVSAVARDADRYPAVRFVSVGGSSRRNVIAIDQSTDSVRNRVADVVRAAVNR
jgi:basic membrane lipoprotein Med (substrate-binding protein (PBP1-ABC) superfamily)